MKNLFRLLTGVLITLPLICFADYAYFNQLPKYVSPLKPIIIHSTQNIFQFVDKSTMNDRLISKAKQSRYYKKYLGHFFSPWTYDSKKYAKNHLKKYEVDLARSFSRNLGWGENYHRHTRKWFTPIKDNMNLADFPNTDRPAIATRNARVRVLPTMTPHYGNFRVAGQGYPMDSFQESSLFAGTPIRVWQISKDRQWAFVSTPSVTGWIKVSRLAYVDKAFIKTWRNSDFAATIVKEFALGEDRAGLYRFRAFMGSIFPFVKKIKDDYEILIPVENIDGNAVTRKAIVSAKEIQPMPLKPTSYNIVKLINQLLGVPYGWGGMYFYGDCSSSMKSLFTPLGIWLPRNSKAQMLAYPHKSLEHLSPKARQKAVLKYGTPFVTLLYVTGHVMLYIGKYEGDVMTFQSVWAMATMAKSGKLGRDVIGEAVLMPLRKSYGMTGMFPQIDGNDFTMTFLK